MKLDVKRICIKCGGKCCFLGGPTITKKERDRILKAGFKNVFIRSGNFYDLKAKNGKCPFLKNNLCLVHNYEPLVCKVWPVFPTFKGNKRRLIVLDCPLSLYLSKKDTNKLKRLSKEVPQELSKANTSELSPKIKRRLNSFNWDKKMKEI